MVNARNVFAVKLGQRCPSQATLSLPLHLSPRFTAIQWLMRHSDARTLPFDVFIEFFASTLGKSIGGLKINLPFSNTSSETCLLYPRSYRICPRGRRRETKGGRGRGRERTYVSDIHCFQIPPRKIERE